MRKTVTELYNHHIGVERGQVPDPAATQTKFEALGGVANPDEMEPVMQDFWIVVFTDRDDGSQIRVGLTRKGRDGLVQDLTGGIVLAGGELPRI